MSPSPADRRSASGARWLLLALAGPVVLFPAWEWMTRTTPFGARLLFDPYDVGVYYTSSNWIVGLGTPYRSVVSEYPPVANLLFAGVRLVSDGLSPFRSGYASFAWVWASLAWAVYVGVLRLTVAELPRPALWLWLNPVTLYFTLLRFDIYPAALTYLGLLAARRDEYLAAARWFGLAIALKGYPLWLGPVLVAFVWRRAGFRRGVTAGVVCLVPTAVATALVYAYAGPEGALMPYKIQAARADIDNSTYHVLAEAFGLSAAGRIVEVPTLARVLQACPALLAAAFLPRGFAELARAGLLAVVGLISFSTFHSPQFVLWLVPLAALCDSRAIRGIVLGMLVATWLYFPIAYDLGNQRLQLAAVTALCLLRFALLGVCAYQLVGYKLSPAPERPATSPGSETVPCERP